MSICWSKIDTYIGNSSSPELTCYRPCPICGSIKFRVVLELNDFQFFTDSHENPKRVNIRECQCLNCFAIYLNPCYSNYGIDVLYPEASQSYGSSLGRADEEVAWLIDKGLLKHNYRVLDIGCYDGSFLAKMPEDVEKVGIDMDAQAINRGRQRFKNKGIDFLIDDFENVKIQDAPNLITMFHVLEHLSRPTAVMRNLRLISNSGTCLIVEVPLLENGFTNDINGFFSAMHMTHFSRSSLKNCLSRTGWKIIEWHEQTDYNGCRILARPDDDTIENFESFQDINLLNKYISRYYESLCKANSKIFRLQHKSNMHFVIWGAGLHTEFLYHATIFFHANRKNLYIIVDSDKMKQGKTWRGISIYAPTVLTKIDWSHALLLISSYQNQEIIANAALGWGVPDDKIIRLYDEIHVH
jgi:2-polyprenyl-3-methyl-5-hydroxy-6-metoxy-1,4-benzoquinol methylase